MTPAAEARLDRLIDIMEDAIEAILTRMAQVDKPDSVLLLAEWRRRLSEHYGWDQPGN